ncbi:MAG: response regulator [Bacteroidales bacterium]|nr:response regulator [Bacteroidales bacterium]MBN2748146.1 response regulator [Bacteroidales bacterium]
MRKRQFNLQHLITRSLLIVFISVVIISLAAFILNDQKKQIFIQSNQEQLENSIDLIMSLESNRLKQVVFDYTFWDEMIEFIQTQDSVWATENIAPINRTYKTDIAQVFNAKGALVYKSSPLTTPILDSISIPLEYIERLYNDRFAHYFIRIDTTIIELHGATIHPNNDASRETSPQGYFFIGKIIDRDYLQNLEEITNTSIHTSADSIHTSLNANTVEIACSKALYNNNGEIAYYLHITKLLPFLSTYKKFSILLLGIVISAMFIYFLVLLAATNRWVRTPLRIVEKALKEENPSLSLELENKGKEFAEIGQLINSFIAQKKALEYLKNKAEESERLKTSFLANMSHEIRTPLNGIVGFTELIVKHVPSDPKLETYTGIIRSCSKDLLGIISDILDYSKLEANRITLNNETFSVKKFIENLSLQYSKQKETLMQKGVELRFAHNQAGFDLFADTQRTKQIITNYINNAIKFTNSGFIEVGAFTIDNKAIMYVKDTGIGIATERHKDVFDRFIQVDSSEKKFGGTGLGLAISKGLANLMHGEVWIESELGKGATFYLSLPLSNKHSQINYIDISTDRVEISDSINWSNKSMILVEDDKNTVELVETFLQPTGITIATFDDPKEAILYATQHEYSVVLMDIQLPGDMDGFEASKRLKRLNPNIPIIAHTAFFTGEEKEKALSSGCIACISKPYESKTLITELAKVL